MAPRPAERPGLDRKVREVEIRHALRLSLAPLLVHVTSLLATAWLVAGEFVTRCFSPSSGVWAVSVLGAFGLIGVAATLVVQWMVSDLVPATPDASDRRYALLRRWRVMGWALAALQLVVVLFLMLWTLAFPELGHAYVVQGDVLCEGAPELAGAIF